MGVEPRDAARLLVATVDARRRAPHGRRPADACSAPATWWWSTTPGCCRRGSGSAEPPAGAGEVLLLEELDDGWWEALVRPSAKLRPGTVVEVGDDLAIELGDDLGRGPSPRAPVGRRTGLLAALDRHGEMPLPPYLGDVAAGRPRAVPDRLRRPAGVGRRAHRRAPPHRRGARAIEAMPAPTVAPRRARGRPRHVPPDRRRRVEDHAMHAERYRVPAGDVGPRAEAPSGWSPWAPRRCAPSSRPRATGALDGRDRPVHPARRYAGGWSTLLLTNFHLPRSSLLVMIDAFVGPRWRELYDDGAGRRATGSCRSATPCSSAGDRVDRGLGAVKLHIDVEATDGAARAGRCTPPGASFRTPIFMPVGTRGAVRARHHGRHGAARRRDHPRQHLPPDAAARRRRGRVARRPRSDFRTGRGHMLTDSGGYQVFSLGPKVTDDGATFRSTYDGSTQHLTPEDAVRIQEQLGADIQMVLDVCAPLPVRPPRARRRGRPDGRLGGAGPGRRHRRDRRPGAVRHRAGRRRRGAAARVGAAHGRARLRRLRRRRAVGGGVA